MPKRIDKVESSRQVSPGIQVDVYFSALDTPTCQPRPSIAINRLPILLANLSFSSIKRDPL